MNAILLAVISVTSIGLICAVILSIFSKILAVKTDERLALIQECLPGVNCGACGYPGCSGYAEALLSGGVKNNLCTPGGIEVMMKISAILGIETGNVVKKSAIVHCKGDRNEQLKKMDYYGIQTCAAAKQLFSGEGSCAFGCLGYGDCKAACPSNAVCIENNLARIKPKLCTGCGLCVKSCPNNLIAVENPGIAVSILCRNIEKGASVRKKCSYGCIACGICVRECPSGAITIKDNLAAIDFEKCTHCGACARVCVTGCIQKPIEMINR